MRIRNGESNRNRSGEVNGMNQENNYKVSIIVPVYNTIKYL